MHVSQCIHHVSTFQAQCHRSDNVSWDSLGLKEQILTNYQFLHHLSQVLCIGYMHRGCQLLPQAFIFTLLLSDEPHVELEILETTLSTPVQSSLPPSKRKKGIKKYKEGNRTFLHLYRFPASPSKSSITLVGLCVSLLWSGLYRALHLWWWMGQMHAPSHWVCG